MSGNKTQPIERLQGAGYKPDGRKYKHRLFQLTSNAIDLVERKEADRAAAISCAENALMSLNYGAAIEAYRNFDKKWGFDHTSGKTHTIFAYYDISYSMFRFLENHPMSELRNTDNFKKALRACLLAGLMRGTQSSYELAADFKMICDEQINCPSPLKLFDYDRMVIREMQRQIEFPQTARLNIISPMCFIYAGRPIVNGNPRTHRQLTNRRRAL